MKDQGGEAIPPTRWKDEVEGQSLEEGEVKKITGSQVHTDSVSELIDE